MFFDAQPNFYYPHKTGVKLSKNLFRRVRFRDNLNALYVASTRYTIQDGETPETISNKQYGSPEWYWTILILNNIIDVKNDWPVTATQLEESIVEKYGDEADYPRHWETKQITDASGNIILPAGKIIELYEGRTEQLSSGYFPRVITSSGEFKVGLSYKIEFVGPAMDFTAIGASSNTVGTTFVASGSGPTTGTGVASSTYTFTYKNGTQTVNLSGNSIIEKVTNREYEYRENEKKKEIFLIRNSYLSIMKEEIESLFAYDTEYKIDSAKVRFSET